MASTIVDALVRDTFIKAAEYAKNNRVSLPANPEQYEGAIRAILGRSLHNLDAVARDGTLSYISGANGSAALLMEAVADQSNTTPHIVALRQALATSLQFNFQEAKAEFTKLTGKSLDGDNYNEFRPLFAGMDRAITQYALTNNLNRISDSVVPVIPAGTPDNKVRIFAVALTPEQAAAQSAIRDLPVDEARTNAQRFADFFFTKRHTFTNITLLDDGLRPVYVRSDSGLAAVADGAALAQWQAHALSASPSGIPPYPPAASQQPGISPSR